MLTRKTRKDITFPVKPVKKGVKFPENSTDSLGVNGIYLHHTVSRYPYCYRYPSTLATREAAVVNVRHAHLKLADDTQGGLR